MKQQKGETMDLNKGLLGLLFLAVFSVMIVAIVAVDNAHEKNNQDVRSLSVSGTQVLEVAPDEAVILLDVSTRGKDAASVSAENKVLVNKVMAALKDQGVAASDIETTGLSLHRWFEWNNKDMTNEDKGYEQVNSIRITTSNLDKVGSILDAAIAAGANSVQDVQFKLKDATEEQYKEQAMQQATAIAKKKASVLAKAAGTELGKVTSISESGGYQPWYYNAKMDFAAADAGSATQISPQKVSLSMTVNLNYELGRD
jgi:uncharacterized protein YggE